jgi:hypothetical protein
MSPLEQPGCEGLAEETGAAGDEYVHRRRIISKIAGSRFAGSRFALTLE